MTSTFKDELRAQLLAGLPRHRRRQHRRRVAAAALAVTALAGLGVAALGLGAGEPSTGVRAGPGATPTTTPPPDPTTVTTYEAPTEPPPPLTYPVPGGPALTEADAEEAIRVVDEMLTALRADDIATAATRWTGYPDTLGTPPDQAAAEIAGLLQQFREQTAWLLASDDPTFHATPAPGFGATATAVVTVEVEVAGGGRRAAAFVMTGPTPDAGILVDRLPTSIEGAVPPEGTPLEPGDTVTLPAFPVEGGARAFVNGTEVASSLDLDAQALTVPIPEDVTGAVTLTVSMATPESPDAVALWYPVAPTTTEADEPLLDDCPALAHVASVVALPPDLGPELVEGMGGGAEPPTACTGHFSSPTRRGRSVTVVQSRSPFSILRPTLVGQYETGPVEDGSIAVYRGDSLPEHYVLAYGLDDGEADAVFASL